jgi:hypothetical protein
MYTCKICNYESDKKYSYNKHVNTQKHLNNEKNIKYCSVCKIYFSNIGNFNRHNKNNHKNEIKENKEHNDKTENISEIKTIVNNSKKEIIKSNNETKEEIKEVKKVVVKALHKASSLIKYLMENHPSIPPLKKINYNQCIELLRIEFDCNDKPKDEETYALEKRFIKDYKQNVFIKNISKSILSLVNQKDPEKQSIYNTDCSRLHYIIKTSLTQWYEDKAGIKFTDYIIKPVLNIIHKKISEYIDNDLDKINKTNMRKNNLDQNIELYNIMTDACRFERYVTRDETIKLILKELSPHLRFIEKELQEFEQEQKDKEEEENNDNYNTYSYNKNNSIIDSDLESEEDDSINSIESIQENIEELEEITNTVTKLIKKKKNNKN